MELLLGTTQMEETLSRYAFDEQVRHMMRIHLCIRYLTLVGCTTLTPNYYTAIAVANGNPLAHRHTLRDTRLWISYYTLMHGREEWGHGSFVTHYHSAVCSS